MGMRQLKITRSITNRESQSLERYLQEIGKVDLITPEEEVELAQKIKLGDHRALEKLTRANLRFVVSVAKQYQNQWLSLSDLINEWNLGLIKAAQRFDETRGFKFISYAVWWIRQSILQALAEQARIVRLPLNKVWLSNKIGKAFSQLTQEYEREPSAEELAELLDITTEEVETTMGIAARHVSIDAAFDPDDADSNSLINVLENPNADNPWEWLDYYESLRIEIERSLHLLTERQRDVIKLYFGIWVEHQMSLEDIGDKFSLTRERVRQIKDKGLTRLRGNHRIKALFNNDNHVGDISKGINRPSQGNTTTSTQTQSSSPKAHDRKNTDSHNRNTHTPSYAEWLEKEIHESSLPNEQKIYALHFYVKKDREMDSLIKENALMHDIAYQAYKKVKAWFIQQGWIPTLQTHALEYNFAEKEYAEKNNNSSTTTPSSDYTPAKTDTPAISSPNTTSNFPEFKAPAWYEDVLIWNPEPFCLITEANGQLTEQIDPRLASLLSRRVTRPMLGVIRIAQHHASSWWDKRRFIMPVDLFYKISWMSEHSIGLWYQLTKMVKEKINYETVSEGVKTVQMLSSHDNFRKDNDRRPALIDFTLGKWFFEAIKNPSEIYVVPPKYEAGFEPTFLSENSKKLYNLFTRTDDREVAVNIDEVIDLLWLTGTPSASNATFFRENVLDKLLHEINENSDVKVFTNYLKNFMKSSTIIFSVLKAPKIASTETETVPHDELHKPIETDNVASRDIRVEIEAMNLNETQQKIALHLFVERDTFIEEFMRNNTHFYTQAIEIGTKVKKLLDAGGNNVIAFSGISTDPTRLYALLAQHIAEDPATYHTASRLEKFFADQKIDVSSMAKYDQMKILTETIKDLNKTTDMVVSYRFNHEWTEKEEIVFNVGIKWYVASSEWIIKKSQSIVSGILIDKDILKEKLSNMHFNDHERLIAEHIFVQPDINLWEEIKNDSSLLEFAWAISERVAKVLLEGVN